MFNGVPNHCIETTKNKIICATEKNKSLRILNQNQKKISRIKVDNCAITGECKRCDYLFEIPKDNKGDSDTVIYVELKGRNIDDAIEQLESTLNLFNTRHKMYIKNCYVICSFVPRSSPLIHSIQQRFRKIYGSSFIVRERSFEVQV